MSKRLSAEELPEPGSRRHHHLIYLRVLCALGGQYHESAPQSIINFYSLYSVEFLSCEPGGGFLREVGEDGIRTGTLQAQK